MKKRRYFCRSNHIGLLLLSFFFAISALAEEASTPPVTAMPLVKKAETLLAAGKLLEARKIYEDLLEAGNLEPSQFQWVQKKYEDLNREILLSRRDLPGSEFYTVQPGDNLYNLAKKYGTTVAFLQQSNGLQSDIIHPGMKLKVLKGSFTIVIDKSENTLRLFFNGRPVKTFPVATGENNSTPVGEFKVVNKVENPTWYHAGAVIPPGSPENILGTRWMGFDHPGYGIHGTTQPEGIGKQVSAGCVRMYNEDVEELYDLVPIGTKVIVKN